MNLLIIVRILIPFILGIPMLSTNSYSNSLVIDTMLYYSTKHLVTRTIELDDT